MTSPYPTGAQQAPVQPSPKYAGFASAAMGLGILSFVLSFIPLLNLFGALLAMIGGALSLPPLLAEANKGHKSRKFAIVALIFSVVAVFITFAMYGVAADKTGSSVNNGTISDPVAGSQPATETQVRNATPTWGETYEFKDSGITVTVAAPTDCTPGRFSVPSAIERAVQFSITIANGSDTPFDSTVMAGLMEAQFAGTTAAKVFDSNGGCDSGLATGATILPGESHTYKVTLAVTAAPGKAQLVFQTGFMGDKAVIVGQV